tara:strand:- start:40907 stop:41632 length:726 start_codon:yes stop_codon:yes gene_type:complete
MKIIPAIDIIDGKCVRLSKGNYNSQITYNQNPLEVAKTYEDHGIEFLHLVDLDGAKSNHIINYSILEIIASKTNLKIDFGGGIKTENDVNLAFNSGANQVTCGSVAVKQPEIFCDWILNYGSEKIILGADVRGKYVATDGWINTSNQTIFDFINFYKNKGIETVTCTDISKDGMLEGPSFKLYSKIIDAYNINLVASGGVSEYDDILKLDDMGCYGIIIGKAIYENKISLKQLENFILKQK